MKETLFRVVIWSVLALFSAPSQAQVFYSKDEALKIAFPHATSIVSQVHFISEKEARKIEQMARTRLDSRLFTFYTGKKGDEKSGYAAIDSVLVRTLPATFMVVLSLEGNVQSTVVLAFHEPPEYVPARRWLRQFDGKGLAPDLWVGRGIAGIAGSTLSAHALTVGVRKILALFQVLIKEKE
jgi:hypothetical protein